MVGRRSQTNPPDPAKGADTAEYHGRFLWYEPMTTDPAAAAEFYASVLGWSTRASPVEDMNYTLFIAGETPAAGMIEMPEQMRTFGVPPNRIGYIGADDVDRTLRRARQLGAIERLPPGDIAGIGRFAVVTDPRTAHFTSFRWRDAMMPAPSDMDVRPGHVGWHELLAADWPKALDFCSALFGWRKVEAVDMGDMGTYQLFAAAAEEPAIGGMFDKPAAVQGPFWLCYFNTGAIDAASKPVTEAGGRIANRPIEVPGAKWIVQCFDPQGAMLALLGDGPAD